MSKNVFIQFTKSIREYAGEAYNPVFQAALDESVAKIDKYNKRAERNNKGLSMGHELYMPIRDTRIIDNAAGFIVNMDSCVIKDKYIHGFRYSDGSEPCVLKFVAPIKLTTEKKRYVKKAQVITENVKACVMDTKIAMDAYTFRTLKVIPVDSEGRICSTTGLSTLYAKLCLDYEYQKSTKKGKSPKIILRHVF